MLKVGTLCFTNAYPLFYALRHRIIPNDIEFVSGMPVTMNDMLSRGELDIAMINSVAFLKDRFSYILLSDLGLAGTERNMSVRLYYRNGQPVTEGATVYVPAPNAASANLLQVLCTHCWKITPHLVAYTCQPKELFKQACPFLLIGDNCLQNYHQTSHHSIDITEAWHMATRKSFIFAVIATKSEVFQRHPQEVIHFHQLLEDSFQWAAANRSTIVSVAAKKTHCSEEFMNTYYNSIEYRLLPKHFHGLNYFSGLEASPL